MKKLLLVLSVPLLLASSVAQAHFNLIAPPPTTSGTDGGKGVPPCGDNPTPGTATPAQGGHPLTIKLNETVQHTGFYRFALTLDSLAALPLDNVVKDAQGNILPPNGMPMGTSASALYEDPPVFPVLADHMFVHTAMSATATLSFQGDITLPNVNCDRCTLQVIEFMAGHDFNTLENGAPAGGYFYHHCANLKITADPAMPIFNPGAGGGSAGGASSTTGGGGAGGSAGTGVASGGVPSSGGAGGFVGAGAGGATQTGAAGTSTGGTEITGTAGSAAAMPADNAGCSCSLGRRSGATLSFGSLLLALLALGRRRGIRLR